MIDTNEIVVEHGGHTVAIPYVEIAGSRDGPTAFVSAGMHGNEVNGIAIAKSFIDHLAGDDRRAALAGRLVVLPILNPSGFTKMQRRVAEDDMDLNRSFGFELPASLSQAMANALSEQVFKQCQFGVDLHDAGGRAVLLPHARVHSGDDARCHNNTKAMGQLFGTKLVIERPGRQHMLAIDLNERFQIPVLTVEIGGAQRLYTEYHQAAIIGLKNILSAFGMLDWEISDPGQQYYLKDRYGAKVSEACLLTFDVELGQVVHAGDRLGELYFPQRGETEIVHSPMCGPVFSLWDRHQAPAGATLYSVLEEEACHVERTTLDRFEPLPELTIRHIAM